MIHALRHNMHSPLQDAYQVIVVHLLGTTPAMPPLQVACQVMIIPDKGYQLPCQAMQPLQVHIASTQLPRPQHVVLLHALHAPPGYKPGDDCTRYYTILSTPLQV